MNTTYVAIFVYVYNILNNMEIPYINTYMQLPVFMAVYVNLPHPR